MSYPPHLFCHSLERTLVAQSKSPEIFRFGAFELDRRNGELRRDGNLLKIQPQPAKVLLVLVRNAGQIVTRQQLVKEVWGSETFVDFEQGLNFAIRQIRAALEDDVDHPRFLETFPKRGYRFTAEVRYESISPDQGSPVQPSALPPSRKWALRPALVVGAVATLSLLVLLGWSYSRRTSSTDNQIHSLAVLPLHNLSGDTDQEYFSRGMTDELITDLAKINQIRVTSHTSVLRYKDSNRPLPEIARELGVDALIEGSVMRSGDRVRITAQLIDARTDQHIWAESYERDFRDVLTLQNDVAQQIATKVGVNLTTREQARLANNRGVDPVAHEAYLKGNFYWNRLTCAGLEKGLESFQLAITRDPNFARAYLGVADTYFTLLDWGCWPPKDDTFAKIQGALRKALELDPDLATAHLLLAKIAFRHDFDWPKAEREYVQTVALDPNVGHDEYAIFLVSMGRQEQGLAEIRKALELDPTSEVTNMVATYVFYLAHQFDQAIAQGKKTLELFPNSAATYHWMGEAYEAKDMNDESIDAYLKAKLYGGQTAEEVAPFRDAYQKSGMLGYWQAQLVSKRTKALGPCWKIIVYRHFREKEETLQLLDWSVQNRCTGLQTMKVDPVYDHIRDDPRFQQLLARLQL